MSGPSRKKGELSNVSTTFIANTAFLKRFVGRYFLRPEEVEDIVQEAYLRAYVAEKTQVIDQPKAFIFHIAKNVALTELTRKSREITDYLDEVAESDTLRTAAPADDEAMAQELIGLYCEALVTLPDKCREVLLLRKLHGLRHKEIAERMSLSVSSVEKYLRQGLLACDAYISRREGSYTDPMPAESR